MKNHEEIPMPGAKRKNQNSPSGLREKHPLVLPKVDGAATPEKYGPESTVPAKQTKRPRMVKK